MRHNLPVNDRPVVFQKLLGERRDLLALETVTDNWKQHGATGSVPVGAVPTGDDGRPLDFPYTGRQLNKVCSCYLYNFAVHEYIFIILLYFLQETVKVNQDAPWSPS